MKLIVGLGNPGKKYAKMRHNVGFMVIDAIASKVTNILSAGSKWIESKNAKVQYLWGRIGDEKIELLKPLTFMNDSGRAVSYAKRKHKVSNDDLYVIHDDLDIKLGEYKITKGKGPREHKGLLDIYEKLGVRDFWHVRIGVDNRVPASRVSGEDYVLQNFTDEEMEVVRKAIEQVSEKLISPITKQKLT